MIVNLNEARENGFGFILIYVTNTFAFKTFVKKKQKL